MKQCPYPQSQKCVVYNLRSLRFPMAHRFPRAIGYYLDNLDELGWWSFGNCNVEALTLTSSFTEVKKRTSLNNFGFFLFFCRLLEGSQLKLANVWHMCSLAYLHPQQALISLLVEPWCSLLNILKAPLYIRNGVNHPLAEEHTVWFFNLVEEWITWVFLPFSSSCVSSCQVEVRGRDCGQKIDFPSEAKELI